MNETKNIMSTPVNELTVGQTIKLNVAVAALVVGAVVISNGGAVAVNKFKAWNRDRKLQKELDLQES